MAILASALYDPAVAVTKVTDANLAMTALDTTNLRLTFTVPASGRVMARLVGTIHGAAGSPNVLFGVLEGSTIRGRIAPALMWAGSQSATSRVNVEALFSVAGLTPGASLTWDAAYGVEVGVASSGIKYGGPNDSTTANNAFGAFVYEIWSA